MDTWIKMKNDEELTDEGYLFIPPVLTKENGIEIVKNILKISLRNDIKNVHIYINSYGGNTEVEVQILDALKYLKKLGKSITTICNGVAASASFDIFVLGDERIISDYSILMCHQHSGGGYQKYHDQIARRKWEDWVHEVGVRHLMECLDWSREKVEEELLNETDVFITPEEAVEHGIATQVI